MPNVATPYGTSLLIHGDGLANDTDIKDYTNKVITKNGAIALSSSYSKFGKKSIYFNPANNQYFTVPYSDDFMFGTAPFSISFWVNFVNVSSTKRFFSIGTYTASSTTTINVSYESGTGILLNGVNACAWTPTIGQWYHFAMSRVSDSGAIRFYIDGSQIGSDYTSGGSYTHSNVPIYFGCWRDNVNYYLSGYMNDILITKGYTPYTGTSFTVPVTSLRARRGWY